MVDTSGHKHSMTFHPVCNGVDRYDHKYILTSYLVTFTIADTFALLVIKLEIWRTLAVALTITYVFVKCKSWWTEAIANAFTFVSV